MSKHTELPWKITDGNRNGDVYIGSEKQHHFIIVENSPFSGGDAKATAELIVRVCNEYEELIEQRKDLLDLIVLSLGALVAIFIPDTTKIGDTVHIEQPYVGLMQKLEAAIDKTNKEI